MSRVDLPLSRHAWDIPAPIAPRRHRTPGFAHRQRRQGRPSSPAREALLLLTDQDLGAGSPGSTPLSARTTEILRGWQKTLGRRGDRLGRGRWSTRATTPSAGMAAEVVLHVGESGPHGFGPDRRVCHPSGLGLADPGRRDDAAFSRHFHPRGAADELDRRPTLPPSAPG